ncbi:recombinase family protein [Lysinibacillus sp. FSL P2-0066]|uniref:recombinase family protein n=1 Tax=Lysinibacillus TaxID=400634 RepID=UPI00403F210D
MLRLLHSEAHTRKSKTQAYRSPCSIRQLKDKNIAVFFEKENINTMDSKGEVLLTIVASLAQQESQSLSQNVKLGIQYRYQQGEVQINHKRFLGYTKDENNS